MMKRWKLNYYRHVVKDFLRTLTSPLWTWFTRRRCANCLHCWARFSDEGDIAHECRLKPGSYGEYLGLKDPDQDVCGQFKRRILWW